MSLESNPGKPPRRIKQQQPIFRDGRTDRPLPDLDLSKTGEGPLGDKQVDPDELLAEIRQLQKTPRSSRYYRK